MLKPTRRFLTVTLVLLASAMVGHVTSADEPLPTIADCMRAVGKQPPRQAAVTVSSLFGLPDDLIVNLISKRENRSWDPIAVSSSGAIGLAQVKPIAPCSRISSCNRLAVQIKQLREVPTGSAGYAAARAQLAQVENELNHRLGVIESKLKLTPYNLCWSGRILADNADICHDDVACTLAGYLNGEYTSRYIAEILE